MPAKLDRLSRDAHFLFELQKANVQFVAADMPEANEMIVGIMAVVAQAERKMISARTKAALAAAKARGQRLGGLRPVLSSAHTMKSAAVRQAKAKGRAADIAPVIANMREQGVTTLRGMARGLSERGIPTARGHCEWTPMQVARLLECLGA